MISGEYWGRSCMRYLSNSTRTVEQVGLAKTDKFDRPHINGVLAGQQGVRFSRPEAWGLAGQNAYSGKPWFIAFGRQDMGIFGRLTQCQQQCRSQSTVKLCRLLEWQICKTSAGQSWSVWQAKNYICIISQAQHTWLARFQLDQLLRSCAQFSCTS